jgi:dihydropteroate synthase
VFRRKRYRLRLPSRTLLLGERTLVMGVLNVTPDSFSDGGLYFAPEAAVRRALEMERAGADLLDIGGESARPGAEAVSLEEELRRVLPVLEHLKGRLRIPVSIETRKPPVAEAAVARGAEILNDISGLRDDARLAEVARRHRLPMILMHMRGAPRTMQQGPFAANALRDVRQGLRAAIRRGLRAGLKKSGLILDPGIGFGKKFEQNYQLLARLPALAELCCPLLIGTSRKTFIGNTLGGAPANERVWGTAATVTAAILGGVHIVRVHDVAEMVQVARVADAIRAAG